MPEQDPARRAVITGLGAIMPIGNDFPTYWANLQAGVTGTRTIQGFDASAHEVRIAAEVLDFDPATVMSLAEQCVPGTINYREFDPACDVWVVPESRPMDVRYALSNNIGLGGHNGAVIFKRYDGD